MPRSDTPRLPAGGVTRSSLLLNAGWSRHQLDRAVGAGLLTRPKKGWLARRDADPALVYAATHGVIISCVSQAKRRGLWVPHHDRSHAAVRVPGRTDAGSTVLHWRAPLLQREPHSLEDPIENALDLVAHCLPFEDAVAVWDSAATRGIITRQRMARLPLRGSARAVLAALDPFADSGLETYVRLRTKWLRVRCVSQAWIAGHRVDLLFGDRLVLQIDGGTHVGPQRTRDNEHDAQLRLLGYTVIRVGYFQVIDDWPAVQHLLVEAIAQGLHRAAAH
ncbi:endonuclease domain-containing protein [Leucobacter alluvii]